MMMLFAIKFADLIGMQDGEHAAEDEHVSGII